MQGVKRAADAGGVDAVPTGQQVRETIVGE
jgi:hypothetical protein